MPGGSQAIRQLTEKQLPRRPVLLALALVSALVSTASFTGVARGTAVFVSNAGSKSVSPFSIGANGALSPITCSPTSNCDTGLSPHGIAVGPSGRFLYTANSVVAGTVSPFEVNADGSLAPIACSPTSNCNAGTTPTGVAVSPSERFLYVTSGGVTSKVSVFAIDSDGSISPIPCNPPSNCNTGMDPYGVAVSPSGHYLYAANFHSNNVSVFAINSDGSLLPLPCPTNCSTGTEPTGVAITPSGRFLYVTSSGSDRVSIFAIGSDGSLAPVACSPTSNCDTGAKPYSLAVSPSGGFLYVSNYDASTVSAFAIGTDGALAPVACNTPSNCSTGTTPTGVAVSPSGRFLYVTNHADTVSVFAIGPDGSTTPVACDPTSNCSTGTDPDFQSVAAQPDQGPRAVFGVRAGRRGVPTGFDGSASSDFDGSVVRYDWDFGDGTKAPDGGVTLTHNYARNGRYTVKLTVTDGSGCSTTLVFTGQTASCNGTSAATRSQPVGVDITQPKISGMKVAPRVMASARAVQVAKRRKLPRSATIKYRLSERAIVQLRLERRTLGRRVGKRCRRATRANRKRRACLRYVRIGRVLTQKGKKGRNSLRLSARVLEVHRLRAGRYRVVARATDAFGNRSRTKHATFSVAKR